jgi:hypothetical protein
LAEIDAQTEKEKRIESGKEKEETKIKKYNQMWYNVSRKRKNNRMRILIRKERG